MKLVYLGKAPVNNIFGDWKTGDIKEVPDGTRLIGFEEIKELGEVTTIKPMQEKLQDKMERDNVIIHDNKQTPKGNKKKARKKK